MVRAPKKKRADTREIFRAQRNQVFAVAPRPPPAPPCEVPVVRRRLLTKTRSEPVAAAAAVVDVEVDDILAPRPK